MVRLFSNRNRPMGVYCRRCAPRHLRNLAKIEADFSQPGGPRSKSVGGPDLPRPEGVEVVAEARLPAPPRGSR